jgi:hypothetical protein
MLILRADSQEFSSITPSIRIGPSIRGTSNGNFSDSSEPAAMHGAIVNEIDIRIIRALIRCGILDPVLLEGVENGN